MSTTRDLRTPVRTEDARETAPRRQRKNKGASWQDDFYVNPALIPEGSTYEWKRLEVAGQLDQEIQISYREQGWEPVQAESIPSMVLDAKKGGAIIRKGMVLMERPVELTEEARAEDRAKARIQVATKEAEIQGISDPRVTKIKKTIERMEIPD